MHVWKEFIYAVICSLDAMQRSSKQPVKSATRKDMEVAVASFLQHAPDRIKKAQLSIEKCVRILN